MVALSMIASIAWAQTGPVRTVSTTLSPTGGQHGYVSDITLKYRFIVCNGDIKVEAARQSIRQTAYIFEGKRYSSADVGGFPSNVDYHIDFTTDVYLVTGGREQLIQQGVRVLWVNSYNLGGCIGSSHEGYISSKDRNYIPNLVIKNVKITSRVPTELSFHTKINAKAQEATAASNAGQQTQGQGGSNSTSSLWGSNANSNSSSGSQNSQGSQTSQSSQTSGSNHASEYQMQQTVVVSSGYSPGSGASTSSSSGSSGSSRSSSSTSQSSGTSSSSSYTSSSSGSSGSTSGSSQSSGSSGISAQQRANNERALAAQRQTFNTMNENSRQSFQASTQRMERLIAGFDEEIAERNAREAREWEEALENRARFERQEAEEAERKRVADEAEAAERRRIAEAEAAHRTYISNVRQSISKDYVDSKVPITSDNITVNEIWYFAYEVGSAGATVTEVFPITRNNDGSWIYKPNLLKEINEAGVRGNVVLVGYFSTKTQAQEALNDFKQRVQAGEMSLKTVAYAGKVQRQSGLFGGSGTSGTATEQSGERRQSASSLWGN